MSKRLVYYVDDDPDDRTIVADAFQTHKQDLELQTFADGVDLLRHLNSNPEVSPCLIILDINMPKLDGKDTLRLLRDNPKFESTPVVLFTTSSLPADSYFARHYKAGFITKPIDLQHMNVIVHQFIDYCKDGIKSKI